MDQITETIIDTQLFFKEIKACQFSLRQEDLEFSKGIKNLDKVNRIMSNATLPSDNTIQFCECSKQENFDYTKEIVHDLYNGKYDTYIESLLPIFKVDSSLQLYDVAIAGDYDIETMTKTYEEGIIYDFRSSYCPIALSHELTHAIVGNTITPGFNYNYNELCSKFADLFAAQQMDKKINNGHFQKIKILQLNALKTACIEFINTQMFIKDFQKPNSEINPITLAFKYSYYNSYQYIIGTVFSHHLFDIYQEIENEVLQEFQKAVAHEITISELLAKYNISLRNFETVNSFQKSLTQITQ